MRRFYYFGCRQTKGHNLHTDVRYVDGRQTSSRDHLDGGFPIFLLDRTFAPISETDQSWKLTQLRFNHHVISIIACHDNTIDERPGSNACFVVVDEVPWNKEQILIEMRKRFPDCCKRLREVA